MSKADVGKIRTLNRAQQVEKVEVKALDRAKVKTDERNPLLVGDDMVGFDGDQKEKCAVVLETILGLQPDIPETLMGWPV